MGKKLLALAMMVLLVSALVAPVVVSAGNHTGTQNASTSLSTSLAIVAPSDNSTAITSITFPAGAPAADIENPFNNIDGAGALEQTYSGTAPIPVIAINNSTGASLIVTLSVGTWDEAVASERYLLVQSTDSNVVAGDVTPVLTSDGNSATVATGITISDGTVGHLYLEITLNTLSGQSGTSSLTILGESP